MIVMIGKNRFGLVPEVEEELNISGCTQHGAGVKFVGIGRGSFDFVDEGLPHSLTLMSGADRKQSDDTDAGHRPETHGTGERSSFFRHENMFFPGILFQALEGFCHPAADFVEAGIFTERGLLHLEESRKIRFGGWSNVNHHADPGLEKDAGTS